MMAYFDPVSVGGGQPQTCWNLPFGDGEKWGKVGKMGQIKNFEIHV